MPHREWDWQQQIKAVEREHVAVRLAVDRLLADSHRDPTVLIGEVKLRDVRHAVNRLDATYLIRLFAEFETGLRLFWASIRKSHPRTELLLDRIAATRMIPFQQLRDAHAVREYRNALVHEREDAVAPISLSDARGDLCRFFSFLPPEW